MFFSRMLGLTAPTAAIWLHSDCSKQTISIARLDWLGQNDHPGCIFALGESVWENRWAQRSCYSRCDLKLASAPLPPNRHSPPSARSNTTALANPSTPVLALDGAAATDHRDCVSLCPMEVPVELRTSLTRRRRGGNEGSRLSDPRTKRRQHSGTPFPFDRGS